MAGTHRPTVSSETGINKRKTVTTSAVRKVSKGMMQMRSRFGKRSWLTAALALTGVMMLAAPVAAESGSRKSSRPYRVEKLDGELKSRSGRLFGTSRVIITLKPGQETNADQQ